MKDREVLSSTPIFFLRSPSRLRLQYLSTHLQHLCSYLSGCALVAAVLTGISARLASANPRNDKSKVCPFLGVTACQRRHMAGSVLSMQATARSRPNPPPRHAARHVHHLGSRRVPTICVNGVRSKHSIHLGHRRSRSEALVHRWLLCHHHIPRSLLRC